MAGPILVDEEPVAAAFVANESRSHSQVESGLITFFAPVT